MLMVQSYACSGTIQMTSGVVHINQQDISETKIHKRPSIGVCRQCNPLYDGLTMIEHLIFYAKVILPRASGALPNTVVHKTVNGEYVYKVWTDGLS